jgi:hypothetical protein
VVETQRNSRKNYTFVYCEHYIEDGNVRAKFQGKVHPRTGHDGPEGRKGEV